MPNQSIFSDEWRDCLRAHYTVVIRNNDHITERTLRAVMFEAGFSDDDLKQLYIMATAHVDQVADDFVPDMEFLEAQTPVPTEAPVMVAVAMPQEAIEAQLVEEAVARDEAADGDMIEDEPEAEADADEPSEADAADQPDDSPPNPEPDATQMSLF